MNGKDRCLAVIQGDSPDRTPVFPLLMSFAARHLGVPYRSFASNGRVLAEAQLKAAEDFGLDAITVCSDAFRVSVDLGGEPVFPEESPPHLARPLVGVVADINHLRRPDPIAPGSRMADRVSAAAELSRAAGEDLLVLGWVDMPFAEACSACGVSEFMMLLYDAPSSAHRLLDFLTEVVVDFALAQLAAGVPMIGAGDAAASLVSPSLYREFVLPYERRVVEAIHSAGGLVKLHICGKTAHLIPDMISSGADLFNVDHLVPFEDALLAYGAAGRAFKGNLDPVADFLQSNEESCGRKARDLVSCAKGARYMLSAGCEIPSGVPDEVFRAFCNAARA
jgi:MtaA/CmuA family methyltransferase